MRGKQPVTMQDFELLKVLGTGAFGKVFLTRKTSGPDAGTLYALKQTKKSEFINNAQKLQNAMVERKILEHVRDSNFLVTLRYAFQTDTALNLVLDFVNGGDFRFHLNEIDTFQETEAQFYIAELVLALEALHTMGIIYRDLKPENILLDAEGHIVLTDFGLSEEFAPGSKIFKARSFKGTNEYIAPEVSLKDDNDYDFTADWFSLGVIAYEFMVGTMPFTSSLSDGELGSRSTVKHQILTTEPDYPDFLSLPAELFLRGLLTKDPTNRLGAKGFQEVKSHQFFFGLNWDVLAQKEYYAPKIPGFSHPEDISYFDEEITSMPLTSSTDMAPSQGFFLGTGYSYVDPSITMT